MNMLMNAGAGALVVADAVDVLRNLAVVGQAFAGILTGLIAVLGVPLALRQVVNLQRELRRYESDVQRKLDAEANLNISARYMLSHPTHEPSPASSRSGWQSTRAAKGDVSEPPMPLPQQGRGILRLDLTLENVGEGTVDILACLVSARELERQGDEVIAGGRDAQWDDLTTHYWDAAGDSLSPGLSTSKHIVYAPDALARIKAHSRKTLSRIDQVRERAFGQDVYLLYRAFVAARRSSRSAEDVQAWVDLQRALLNVNAPAFREAAGEHDPLGYVASPDGWRLFLHHYTGLADVKLAALRAAADKEQFAVKDSDEYERTRQRLDAELQAYCVKHMLPAWKRFRADYGRMTKTQIGFAALLGDREFRRKQRLIARTFPWASQEVWTEYFYVTLQDDDGTEINY
jgi:hypothetical protein